MSHAPHYIYIPQRCTRIVQLALDSHMLIKLYGFIALGDTSKRASTVWKHLNIEKENESINYCASIYTVSDVTLLARESLCNVTTTAYVFYTCYSSPNDGKVGTDWKIFEKWRRWKLDTGWGIENFPFFSLSFTCIPIKKIPANRDFYSNYKSVELSTIR